MTNQLIKALTSPIKGEGLGKAFEQSFKRICESIGEDAVQELEEFRSKTIELQWNASQRGFELAQAIYEEAEYLDLNCRFDEDNRFGYKSKTLRKNIVVVLQSLGFKKNNAEKLVKAAQFLLASKDHVQNWLKSLTPSHVYVLSMMNESGLNQVISEVKYEDFHLCAGAKDISVRRLEEIRRWHPKKDKPKEDKGSSKPPLPLSLPVATEDIQVFADPINNAEEVIERTDAELVKELVSLVQEIELDVVYGDSELRAALEVVQDPLMTLAEMAITKPKRPTYV